MGAERAAHPCLIPLATCSGLQPLAWVGRPQRDRRLPNHHRMNRLDQRDDSVLALVGTQPPPVGW